MRNKFRAIAVGGVIATVGAMAAVGVHATPSDPQPPFVMERVLVSVSPSPTLAPKALSAPRSSPATTPPRKAVTRPPTTHRAAVTARPTTSAPRKVQVKAAAVPVTYIRSYAMCGSRYQHCIDQGKLTLYYNNLILAGHNYMGWSWLDDVPTGRIVKVTYGPKAGTYKVYAHLRLGRQGGSVPSFGSAALVLQTCAGSGTGFSLLHRV